MKSDAFYIVGMMFIIGMWFARDGLSTLLMFMLGLFGIGIWVIKDKREFVLWRLNRSIERKKYYILLGRLDSIEKLLKNKKRCQKTKKKR